MSLRPLNLPNDLNVIGDVVIHSFRYPENEQWSLQSEDREMMVRSLKKFRMMWPLIELSQIISPKLKDMIRGLVWEEQGKAAGIILIHRIGDTFTWLIQALGVLPEYRRRGIARKLMQAGLDFISKNQGRKVNLVVIKGNLPAYNLYKSLGFVDYSYLVKFRLTHPKMMMKPSLPVEFSQSSYNIFDWKTRYEFIRRITPDDIAAYEPVHLSRFQMPVIARILKPVMLVVHGSKQYGINIRLKHVDKIIAQASYQIEQNNKNKINLSMSLDPEYPDLCPYLYQYLIYHAALVNLSCKIEFSIPGWMKPLINTAEDFKAEQIYQLRKMGLNINK